MNKPFSLKVEDTQKQIISFINEAELPAYCIKDILQKIYTEIENLDKQEIERYIKEEKEEK